MSYLYLAIAIVAEVIGTCSLKASAGFTRLVPSIIVSVGYVVAFFFLSLTLRTIPVGIAYAIWAGAGIALIVAAGAVYFQEIPDLPAIVGVALIVAGVVIVQPELEVAEPAAVQRAGQRPPARGTRRRIRRPLREAILGAALGVGEQPGRCLSATDPIVGFPRGRKEPRQSLGHVSRTRGDQIDGGKAVRLLVDALQIEKLIGQRRQARDVFKHASGVGAE